MGNDEKQCIPVGCVPLAAVAICCGGESASVHAGIHPPGSGPGSPPDVGLETPQVWALNPLPAVGLETPPS